MKAVYILTLALMGTSAHAYVDPAMPGSLNANRVVMPATSYGSSWSTSTDGSGVKLGRNFTIPAPGGRSATAAVSSALSARAVLSIGARALAAGSGAFGAGMLAYDLYEALRVHPSGSGGLLRDPGQPPAEIPGSAFLVSNYGSNCMPGWGGPCVSGSPEGAVIARYIRSGGAASPTCQESKGPGCSWVEPTSTQKVSDSVYIVKATTCTFPVGNMEPSCSANGEFQVSHQIGMIKQCAAVVDPFNPAHSVAGGASPGADGKCPSGRGTAQPIDPEQAAAHAEQVARSADVYKRLMDEILDKQPVPIPKGASTKVETVTPGTVQGPVKSVSGPDGTVQEAVKWDFGRISQDLAENFNAGEWQETKTTTTTKPDGTTDTKTETEAGNTPEDEALENGDQCVLHPNSLGCMDAGTAPEVEPLPVRDVTLDITPQGGWGAETGTCPAPPVVTVLGQSITVDNSVICSFLGGIKFVVIGVCALIAAGIILGSRKT